MTKIDPGIIYQDERPILTLVLGGMPLCSVGKDGVCRIIPYYEKDILYYAIYGENDRLPRERISLNGFRTKYYQDAKTPTPAHCR